MYSFNWGDPVQGSAPGPLEGRYTLAFLGGNLGAQCEFARRISQIDSIRFERLSESFRQASRTLGELGPRRRWAGNRTSAIIRDVLRNTRPATAFVGDD
jgi:hypothetical protein